MRLSHPAKAALAAWLLALGTAAPAFAQMAAPDAGVALDEVAHLPGPHVPKLDFTLAPEGDAMVGDAITLTITADALEGDDVTVPEQSLSPFELLDEAAYTRPAGDGRQTFVFVLTLLALEAGPQQLPAIELRVVTSGGMVGTTQLPPIAFAVKSHLANEPNAEPKAPSEPVVVMEDDYTLLYVLGALLAIALIALITWLVIRWWERREKPEPPPPPPRPPWDIAVEKLADLRRRKTAMIEAGKGAQFVDEASDVVREYLGGHFGFDGLESTTHEMLRLLGQHRAAPGLTDEVGNYLRRCDLVKFAKVEPDHDEVDLIFAKAQDIVQFHGPPRASDEQPAATTGDARDGQDGGEA
jgi:hypothetical protein